jgi:hypothetical protein
MSPRQLLAMVLTASAVLGVMGLAIALAGAVSLPVEPPAAGPPRSCDRSEAACVLVQRARGGRTSETGQGSGPDDPTTEKG